MFSWLNFLTYAIITMITPGPNTIMSMSNASRVGFRKGLPFNFGILSGFAVVAVITTYFANALLELIPKIKTPMLIVGALYMLWLAWQTLRRPAGIEEQQTKGSFLTGFLLQFINPKLYILIIVSMEGYILPYYQGQWSVLIPFALLLALIGFTLTLLWASFGSAFKVLFSKHARVTNTVMALLLVYCAVSLFWA